MGGGSVARALGGALQRAGRDVVEGLREGSSSAAVITSAGGRVVSLLEAARCAVVVLAVPGNALADTARALGDLSGRVVVDATNSFGPSQGGAALQGLMPSLRS